MYCAFVPNLINGSRIQCFINVTHFLFFSVFFFHVLYFVAIYIFEWEIAATLLIADDFPIANRVELPMCVSVCVLLIWMEQGKLAVWWTHSISFNANGRTSKPTDLSFWNTSKNWFTAYGKTIMILWFWCQRTILLVCALWITIWINCMLWHLCRCGMFNINQFLVNVVVVANHCVITRTWYLYGYNPNWNPLSTLYYCTLTTVIWW